jgi:uncharacterized iron-regulated membrane protein
VTLRKTIFWIHLGVGVAAAVVILMMSVTGVILTYEMQLNEWARRGYRATPSGPDAKPLPADVLLERASGASEEETEPSSIALDADPLAPAAVGFGRRQTLYVDRYTGEIRGDGDTGMRRFLCTVMYWHRWFAVSDDNRAIGRAVTGAANLGFLFLVMSGFYLWWPRTWTRKSLRNVTWFRRGLGPKARDFNWHNVIGFWMAVPLLIIVFSGAMISYRWVGNLIYLAVGETPPTRGGRAATAAPATDAPEPAVRLVDSISYQSVLDRAAAESPGWRRLTVQLPETGAASLTVRVDRGSGRQPAKWTNLTFERSSGALTARASGQPESRGQRIRFWLRFAHTGEVYGFIGQTIAGIASVGATVLVWTGLALTWRRFFGARKPVSDSDVAAVVEPVPALVANRWEPVSVNGHEGPEPGSTKA